MENEDLFNGEAIISQSSDETVTLTNKRIRSTSKSDAVSILLHNVSSIEVHSKSYPLLLVLAILSLLISALPLLDIHSDDMQILFGGVAAATAFALLYFFSRKSVVSIHPHGGRKIEFSTSGMKHETVMEFVNKIEKQMIVMHESNVASTFKN